MQDCSLYLGKANLMQKMCKRGPQSSEIFGQKFQWIYHLGKFTLVKILEGTLLMTIYRMKRLVMEYLVHPNKKIPKSLLALSPHESISENSNHEEETNKWGFHPGLLVSGTIMVKIKQFGNMHQLLTLKE